MRTKLADGNGKSQRVKTVGLIINRERPSRIGLLHVVFNFQVPIAVLKTWKT